MEITLGTFTPYPHQNSDTHTISIPRQGLQLVTVDAPSSQFQPLWLIPQPGSSTSDLSISIPEGEKSQTKEPATWGLLQMLLSLAHRWNLLPVPHMTVLCGPCPDLWSDWFSAFLVDSSLNLLRDTHLQRQLQARFVGSGSQQMGLGDTVQPSHLWV